MTCRLLVSIALSLHFTTAALHAEITTIARSGSAADGVADAQFNQFTVGPLNSHGHAVFTASMMHGPGDVAADNDTGVWYYNGSNLSLIARKGSGDVPEVGGANFATFSNLGISDEGDIALRAVLETGVAGITSSDRHGLWRYSDQAETLLARTRSTDVPGVEDGQFAALQFQMAMSRDGRNAMQGRLETGSGGVGAEDARGVWTYFEGTGELVAREGTATVPGVTDSLFASLGNPVLNDENELAFIATLQAGAPGTLVGIWNYSELGIDQLVARTGVGDAPGVSGASFESFSDPSINNQGQLAFAATLNGAHGKGVWRHDEAGGQLIARSGNGNVPGGPGTSYTDFALPLINDAGQVLVHGSLDSGQEGLWLFDDDANRLLLRSESGGVPGLPGANVQSIDAFSMNNAGIVAVAAALQIGPGGVEPPTDHGIWLFDASGNGELIARAGDQLAGGTVESLSLLGGSGGSDGRPSGLNASGELLFAATFTDGGSGLFLYSSASSTVPGDFNGDGSVNSDDLEEWEASFAVDASGDADADGDTDGSDFLIWQRNVAQGGSLTAVPEPAAGTLLALAIAGLVRRGWTAPGESRSTKGQ